jgi:signal transduction histidine kinase
VDKGTRLKRSTKNALGYALLSTLVMVFVTAIPLYSYISLALDHSRFQQEQELKEYATALQHTVYAISPEATDFVYPRSLLYKSALFDEAGNVLFSLLEENRKNVPEGISRENDQLVYKVELGPNRLGATWLVATRALSYNEVIVDALVLVGVVALFVFGFSVLILHHSIQPFEEAARQMDRFFKDAMHELKTPLGVIRLNLEMLGEQIGEHRTISRANSALIALSTIYEDIEYLIKHRRVEYRLERFNASQALQGRLEFFADMIEVKGLFLETDIAPGLELEMNRQEWQRVVDNTLSNAIKYTSSTGTIRVHFQEKQGKCRLCIADTGAGIANTKKIFQRYFRGDEIKGGFGIGLSIVQQICEKYGIEIYVTSTPKKGSQFCYTFNAI